MFKKFFTIACLLAVLCGCKKEDTPKVSKVVRKVECYQGGRLEYSVGYQYDTKGRLSEIVNYSGDPDLSQTFYYSDESITILGDRGASILDVDKKGTPVKIVNGAGIIMCSFGQDGYLNKFNVNAGDSTYSLSAKTVNHNFVELQDFNGNTLKLTYTQYSNDYSIDLNNVPQIDNMFTMLNTLKVTGMYSSDLIKSVETDYATYYFAYNFDNQGRVTDMTVVSTASENSLTEHYKFTY